MLVYLAGYVGTKQLKRVAIDGNVGSESIVQCENRCGDNLEHNFRLDMSYDGTTEVLLVYGIYW